MILIRNHVSSLIHGYVLKSHILEKSDIQLDWVKYAEFFIGTPYRWGGRNSIGLDCSALLQLTKKFRGENLPRDTKEQFDFFSKSNKYNIHNTSLYYEYYTY